MVLKGSFFCGGTAELMGWIGTFEQSAYNLSQYLTYNNELNRML